MKGCLLPDGTLPVVFALRKEIVMQTTDRTAAAIDVDVHRRFSTVTVRNAEGKMVWRQRLDHEDRNDLRKNLET
jgi:hypothetical protein